MSNRRKMIPKSPRCSWAEYQLADPRTGKHLGPVEFLEMMDGDPARTQLSDDAVTVLQVLATYATRDGLVRLYDDIETPA